MKKFFAIAEFSLKENIYNKLSISFLFFCVLIFSFSFFLKQISLYEGIEVTLTMGFVFIEFSVLILTVYLASSQIINEEKEKSIYLILTKPVNKEDYIMGKILSFLITAFFYVFSLGLLFYLIVYMQGFRDTKEFFTNILFIFYKISIMASVAMFFSLLTNSALNANIFSIFYYIISHGMIEIKFAAEKTNNFLFKYISLFIYKILPDFNVLNYRDYLKKTDLNFFKISAYVFIYIIIFTILSRIIFKKKSL